MCLAAKTPSTIAQQKAATTPKLMKTIDATSCERKQSTGVTLHRDFICSRRHSISIENVEFLSLLALSTLVTGYIDSANVHHPECESSEWGGARRGVPGRVEDSRVRAVWLSPSSSGVSRVAQCPALYRHFHYSMNDSRYSITHHPTLSAADPARKEGGGSATDANRFYSELRHNSPVCQDLYTGFHKHFPPNYETVFSYIE